MSYKMKQKVFKSSFSTPSLPLGGVWVATVVILIVGIGGTHAQSTVSISTEAPIEDAHLLEAPYLMFPHIYRAFIHAGRNPGQYNVTVECQGDLILYFKGLNKKKGWAWRFYDATGKQGAGVFLGAVTWKGNFEECLNSNNYLHTVADDSIFDQSPDAPEPLYCSIFMESPKWLNHIVDSLDLPFPVPKPPFIADVCVPASCPERDIQNIVQTYVDSQKNRDENFTVTDSRCFRGRNIAADPSAVWSATLLFMLIGCVSAGTAYDIFLRRSKVRVKRGPDILIGYQRNTKQYGILKVILAPHTTDCRVRRRATISGYEKSEKYKLTEIKLSKERLLHKPPSLPDINTPGKDIPSKDINTQDKVINNNQPPSNATQISDSTNRYSLTAGLDIPFVDAGSDHSLGPGSTLSPSPDKANGSLLSRSSSDPGFKGDEENSPKEKLLSKESAEEDEESDPFDESPILLNTSRSPKLQKSLKHVDAKFPVETKQYDILIPPQHKPTNDNFTPIVKPTDGNRPHPSPASFDAHFASHVSHGPGHLHHPIRQGSVYERQMSVSSEESSDEMELDKQLNTRHRLYDIPEEAKDGNDENGELINTPAIIVKPRPVIKARSLLRDIVLSFSFRRSTKRVMAEGSIDTLFCLNGVRVLSIGWIVLGNVYMILYLNPDVVDNHVDGIKFTQKWWVQAVINTTLASDSFYILSGTLGAYNFMRLKKDFMGKRMRDVMTIKEYLMMIFHRLVRIGPCYLVTIMIFTNLMPYMGKGPRWSFEINSVQTCKNHWWANALFFSNFYKADEMCMPHTYYLVNDFQFGLLAPLFLIPLLCMPTLGFILLGLLVLTQIITTLVLDQGINGNVLRMGTVYFARVYVKPYCRIGVYAIGLGLGYLLYTTNRQAKFRKIPRIICWGLALLIVVILPYITYLENGPNGYKWSGVETAMYEALSRPLWGLALAWIIFACTSGQGAFVNKLLSWNAFVPLCRTTYGVYLLHPLLISVVIDSRKNGFYIDFGALTYEFVATVVCAYGLAFLLITFVESPFICLESSVRKHLTKPKCESKCEPKCEPECGAKCGAKVKK